jgi:hypothetical protein
MKTLDLQISAAQVARLGAASLTQIQNAYNLGTSYTQRLAQIFGTNASSHGMQVHKLIEASTGAPSSVVYSVANMAPTLTKIHSHISAIHSTHINWSKGVMSLRDYIRQAYQSGKLALEQLHHAEARIWQHQNSLGAATRMDVYHAKAIIDSVMPGGPL